MDFLAALLAALAVMMAAWPLVQGPWRRRNALAGRRPSQAGWGRERRWYDVIGPYLGLAEADKLCQHAGRPGGLTGITLLQYQGLAALLTLVVAGLAGIWVGLIGAVLGWFMPRVLLSSMATRRRAQIALELPAFLDLWGLLVSSGEGVETALVEICRRHPNWLLTAEIRRVLERISASGLFGESLVEESKVTGSQELVTVAEQVAHLAEGGGVPSKELARMAEQLREQRVSELMQSAGAMAIVGIFPKLGAIFLSLTPVLAAIILTVMRQL
jgi:tight adherence protein C